MNTGVSLHSPFWVKGSGQFGEREAGKGHVSVLTQMEMPRKNHSSPPAREHGVGNVETGRPMERARAIAKLEC